MASIVYTPAKAKFLKGLLNLLEAGDDIRLALVMSNTTADTDQDAEFVGSIGTLDEEDGANYVRKALAVQAVNQDDPNNRAEFDATDVVFTALGAGTRSCVGAVIYKHVTNDADSPVIAFIEWAAPWNGNGGDVTVQWNGEGILQLT